MEDENSDKEERKKEKKKDRVRKIKERSNTQDLSIDKP